MKCNLIILNWQPVYSGEILGSPKQHKNKVTGNEKQKNDRDVYLILVGLFLTNFQEEWNISLRWNGKVLYLQFLICINLIFTETIQRKCPAWKKKKVTCFTIEAYYSWTP